VKFPSAITILLLIAALVAVSTWLIPSGQYDSLQYRPSDQQFVVERSSGPETLPATQETLDALNVRIPLEKFTSGALYRPVSIPGTYKQTEASPQGFFDLAQAPIKGIIEAADIIFLVLMIGGLIGIMNLTGAFDAGVGWLAKVLKGREHLLIIFTTMLMAAGGTTFGLGEETLAFYPILIPVFLAARYDVTVGVACIYMGSNIGVMCSTINPFSVIIASDAAGISWTTGLTMRLIMLGIVVVITILYILRYAHAIRKDPTKSLTYSQRDEHAALFHTGGTKTDVVMNAKLFGILVVFSLCFITMIVGVSMLGWWFVEMTTVFFVGSIIIGLIARIKEDAFITAFMKGAGDLLGVAFIIGIARGVTVLMNDGQIGATFLYHATAITEGMAPGLFVNSVMLIYSGLSFLIPSTSGMAILTMPIMSPLADAVGLGREIVIDAYIYGVGMFYAISPTNTLLPSIALVKLGYDKWLRFVMPLILILLVIFMITFTIRVW
jgi:uncharacterized ion transporter superfamily protein YfcC